MDESGTHVKLTETGAELFLHRVFRRTIAHVNRR
jgi:hypothetical protein